ncbi:unnamed protein product [Toxocara canis]|uniref:Protein kinase domain-containing protein n=1 Tax=Toxocara canis TaxID=6265 RepID=A0A183UIW3_TOXCA|nr:unnamed protein product [Toxocara canis]
MASGIASFCLAVFVWAVGAECRHDCVDGKGGSCEPTLRDFMSTDQSPNMSFLTTDFSSTTAFSWWAIQVSEPSWRLLKSGIPGMQILERSIERKCMSAGPGGLYGFSFTNVTIDRIYMDLDLSDSATVTDNDRQEIVVDVFYFCCLPKRGCGEFPSSNEEEDILLHLANKTVSIVMETSNIGEPDNSPTSGRYSDEQVSFDVNPVVFLADANAEVKVFSGPLMFSQFDQTDQRKERRTNSIAELVRQGNFCSPDGHSDGKSLGNGECIKYISIKEYFLYCCCYKNGKQCAYTADQEKFSYAKRNARNWRLNANLRSFSRSSHSGEIPIPFNPDNNVTHRVAPLRYVNHAARDVTFDWTYRDFIYSKPLNKRAGHGSLSSEFNIPLWHCAHGLVQVNTSSGEPIGTKETRIMRSQVDERARLCKASFTFQLFTDAGQRRISRSAEVKFGSSNDVSCEDCHLKEPLHVDDLAEDNPGQMNFTLECCCQTYNLCNHRKTNNTRLFAFLRAVESVSSCYLVIFSRMGRGCITSTYAVHINRVTEGGDDRRIVCYRFFDFETCKERIILWGETHYLPEREREELLPIRTKAFNKVWHSCRYLQAYPKNKVADGKARMERIVQFMVCSCEMPLLQTRKDSDLCDDSFAKNQTALAKSSEEVPRPMCYVGRYDKWITAVHTKKAAFFKTLYTPLCIDEVTYSEKEGLIIVSGIYDDFKRNFTNRYQKPSLREGSFHVARICASTLNHICNGLENAYKDLVPELLISASLESYQENNTVIKRVSRKLSVCTGDDDDDVGCSTSQGCFIYHSLDGSELLHGCIDTIPELILNDSSLVAVLDCSGQLYADEDVFCHGIVDTSHVNARMGVLCCCRTKCPLPFIGSGTNLESVFNPFAHDLLF